MDTFERDYDDRPELDVYEEDLIDDADYDVDVEAVARAERELSRRDAGTSRMAERHSRFYALQSILQRQEEEEEEAEDEDEAAVRRRPRLFASRVRVPAGGAARCEAAKEEIPFPDPNVSMTDRTRDILRDAFTYFLWFHDREGENYLGQRYVDAVESMAETEQTSLAVSWTDMNK
ncbi:MAG: hypothetical protein KVP17_001624 [Porospora cf. gigantea B]|uniref:uncharacterized protein n=1 Tax=Porospora cf. gigantea B TaxID=2853592 RepID=UPI003571EE43|nr:MAG: hypothetical protein KVP17_001624 [Porospora cf. gigantea B]